MFILYRREVDSLLTVMLYDDSSSDDSSESSDEDDLDFLLVFALFPEPSLSAPRLNLADLTDC